LIKVDFPEPEGAEITMMLPRITGDLLFLAAFDRVALRIADFRWPMDD
jgi:hypothetical protein